ncbi:very short patch repair endonuclease [Myceligenerans salitolerans]|uniref:Very short patch repair endonuclease n=1 Tax=Myceligenerans salitolerans TaxID=1230528 RepID=A0ABS3I3J7_9MICO|nr:very short patch repair endonuclease [Myceligenerans salitolerans]
MVEQWVSTKSSPSLSGRKSRNTTPEVELRRALHALGARFRLHRRLGPASAPDFVLPGRRIAVWVDGCYWHSCPEHGRRKRFEGPNADLWTAKMTRTRERDVLATQEAEELGWTAVRVWEHEIRADPVHAALRVLTT